MIKLFATPHTDLWHYENCLRNQLFL